MSKTTKRYFAESMHYQTGVVHVSLRGRDHNGPHTIKAALCGAATVRDLGSNLSEATSSCVCCRAMMTKGTK